MVLWTRSAVRSVLASARVLRLPKKAAPAAKSKEKVSSGPLLETAKPGDPIPINYLKNGQGALAPHRPAPHRPALPLLPATSELLRCSAAWRPRCVNTMDASTRREER